MLTKFGTTIPAFIAFVCLAICQAKPAPKVLKAANQNFTTLAEALNDAENMIVKIKEDHNTPAVTFGISVKGQTIWTKAWGYADLENEVPVKVSTRFRLASVSKSFASAYIGTLVDRGVMHYDDPLSKYLNESVFPTKSWKGKHVNLTISQLLSHTSGMYLDDGNDKVVPARSVIAGIQKDKNEPLQYEPGTKWFYSNYGYLLIGAVIESVAKRPYDQVMEEFFHLHGLNHTLVETVDSIFKDRVRHYRFIRGGPVKKNMPTSVEDYRTAVEASYSDGSLNSNIEDLLRYGNLLIDSYKGRKTGFLSKSTITKMWTSYTHGMVDEDENSSPVEYGYAWFLYTDYLMNNEIEYQLQHRNFVWHSGGEDGEATWLCIYPEEEIVAVALSNKGGTHPLSRAVTYTVENVYGLV